MLTIQNHKKIFFYLTKIFIDNYFAFIIYIHLKYFSFPQNHLYFYKISEARCYISSDFIIFIFRNFIIKIFVLK